MQTSVPFVKDLVLIGGGHTHALVLRKWGMDPLPGVRLTVINPGPTAPYSGMLPGHIAGHYSRDALDIDLVRLGRFAGARVILGAVNGIDPEQRQIYVPDRPPIGFDLASVDVGITSAMPALPGFSEHAIPAKPLGAFADAWARYRAGTGAARVAIIGGGVAGVEIAMAMSHALRKDGRTSEVRLIERGRALSVLPERSARRLRRALANEDVILYEDTEIASIEAGGIVLNDGSRIDADFITGAAGAYPHPWIAETGLELTDGFITVDDRLRSSDPSIYAVGDCAHLAFDPRPKAGVYAVRQAPVLFDNLRSALSGNGGGRPFKPQKDYLKLISLGEKSALADRFGVTLAGPSLWRWKDHIDQTFMNQFRDLPAMPPPDLPWPRAAGLREAIGPKPLCGGCGSKVGRGALMHALGVSDTPGDDAAILNTGDTRQVFSTDHLRAMVEDPVVMARIATVHALGDVWAMGATPQAAVLNVILPRQSGTLAERAMSEIVAAARNCLADAGAALVGGHSTQGAELTIGLAVTGLCERDPITLSGAQPGDTLILTKAIGTGVMMAAEMARAARGEDVAYALAVMCQPQGTASGILSHAHAMTDVTGFGLAGHLANICAASGTGAVLRLADVPLLPGALALAGAGIRSTLFDENRQILPGVPDTPRADLLFDPQTGGGLLAAVEGDGLAEVKRLRAAGYPAVCVGQITDQPGQIDVDTSGA